MKIRFALAASALALAACQPAEAPAQDVNGIAALADSRGGASSADEPIAAPQAVQAVQAVQAAKAGCDAQYQSTWRNPSRPVRLSATVQGETCDKGVVLLVLRDDAGTPIYAWTGLTGYLFGLNEAKDGAAMEAALKDWLEQTAGDDGETSELPPWNETEGQAKRSEFPFMPSEWIDEQTYRQLKKDNLPMFCFPQGMESAQCVALHPPADGQPAMAEEIGLWLFPG